MISRKAILLIIIGLFLIEIGLSQKSYIDSTKIKNPKLAWKLSVVPGLGQIYNEKYIKAVGFMSSEYFAVTKYLEYRKTDSIGKRNTWAWWMVGLFILGMLDAYVDAQLSTFPEKCDQTENQTDCIRDSVGTDLIMEKK